MLKFYSVSFSDWAGQQFGLKEIECKNEPKAALNSKKVNNTLQCSVAPAELKFAVVIKKFRFNSFPSSTRIYFDVNEILTELKRRL